MTEKTGERVAAVERVTKETQLKVRLNLDGKGVFSGRIGVPFLEHMLDLLARHGMMDLAIEGQGDTHIDPHHTVEDLGIVLGQALAQALSDKRGIGRMGYAYVPMEETLARAVLDVCGRPYLQFNAEIPAERIGDYESELTEDFFRAVAMNAGLTLHLELLYGKNSHHIVEALFKAFARALRQAVARDAREQGVPSTKGVL
ncbi:MAG TPA: imidazoleglycerol-phosphate dehydratase HisB [Candidatus Sumerlaeota bacterium]|nr:imidazoleglycerol-phosphate dehydratase HisB [Candidatus Sumerlaeota bacterium]HPS01865.1 imidazoleglycerol-phosphate dehydratase HisB [Candidatus Sumerlaeota bacterium]